MEIYGKAIDSLRAGSKVLIATVIECPGSPRLTGNKVFYSDGELLAGIFEPTLRKAAVPLFGQALAGDESGLQTVVDAELGELKIFFHLLLPRPRLVILGGGHVGGALCKMAAFLDYQIVLIDDRPSFANEDSHPDAHIVICDRFEKALDLLKPSLSDYIVIVTRGHRYDRICLEQCLGRDAAYLGMIGSKKRVKAQMQELAKEGYSDQLLNRVYAPIGLSIGAVTEPEIALSILAEITEIRRRSSRSETAQAAVLGELAALEKTGQQAALVTIVETFGSTPRKPGSQMIVYPDGATMGTIGGGCSEDDARREALIQITGGRPLLFRQHLTAEAAAEEGMACGGIMDLFIEPLP